MSKLPKPDACRPCPMYGNGQGFVPDKIVADDAPTYLAQNPSDMEEDGLLAIQKVGRHWDTAPVPPQPLIGPTGHWLFETFMPRAGLTRDDVNLCNVLKCRWRDNGRLTNKLPRGRLLDQAVRICTENFLRIPETTPVIITGGKLAFDYLSGGALRTPDGDPASVYDYRGFMLPGPIRGADHGVDTVGAGLRSRLPHGRTPVYVTLHIADLFRERDMLVPTRCDFERLGRYLRGEWPRTVPDIIRVGGPGARTEGDLDALFARALRADAVVVDTEYVPWGSSRHLLELFGMAWQEDHGPVVLSLDWLGDGVPSYLRARCVRNFARLVQTSTIVFHNAKADLPVIKKNWHIDPLTYARIEDTMHMHAVLWPELPHDLEFLASIYGAYPKLKHLSKVDPVLYNAGDVLETLVLYQVLMKEMEGDPGSWRVYREQNIPLISVIMERERRGLRVNEARVLEAVPRYRAKLEYTNELARAYTGLPINIGSPGADGQVAAYLRDFEGLDLESIDKDHIGEERTKFLPFDANDERHGLPVDYVLQRIEEGAHPLLELRAMYAKDKQIMSHYLARLIEEDDA